MTNKIDELLALPYTRQIRRDDDGDFVATIVEFPGCAAHGESPAEALANLEEVAKAWLSLRIESGLEIPSPAVEEELPSGRWVQRVSRSLHQSCIELAKREGTSLNQLVVTVLAEAVGRARSVPAVSSQREAISDPQPVWRWQHHEASEGVPWVCTGKGILPFDVGLIATMLAEDSQNTRQMIRFSGEPGSIHVHDTPKRARHAHK